MAPELFAMIKEVILCGIVGLIVLGVIVFWDKHDHTEPDNHA